MKKQGKKWLALLLAVVMTAASFGVSVSAAGALPENCVYLGDVDDNETVDAADARLILQTAAQLRTLEGAAAKAADMDSDGTISATDARLALQVAAGLRALGTLHLDTGEVTYDEPLPPGSSQEQVLAYFNTALNAVKPNAAKITLTREVNSLAGEVTGIPESMQDLFYTLLAENMGETDVSQIAPATTLAEKNALFPVENETWSSRLTAADIDSVAFETNGSNYLITVQVKADTASATAAHGVGHHGKVFSIVTPDTITDNSGDTGTMIQNVRVGFYGGTVTLVVDKATGHVTQATYSYVWEMSLSAMGVLNVTMPFRLEQTYVIVW